MRIADLPIRTRMTFGIGAIVLLMIALGTLVVTQLLAITRNAERIGLASAHQAGIGLINSLVKDNGIASSEMLLSTDEDYHRRMLGEIDQRNRTIAKLIDGVDADSSFSPEEKKLLEQIKKQRAVYLEGLDRIRALLDSGKQEEATYAAGEELIPRLYPLLKAVKDFQERQDSALATRVGDIENVVAATRRDALIVAVAAIVLALVVGVWVTRSVSGPLREAVEVARRVAQGDLTVEVRALSGDETGQLLSALSDMTRSLRALAADVATAAHAVADSSTQIAQGNVDLSQRTDEQASALEETAGSMEELTATVNQNAEHAREANEVAAGASQVAEKGGRVVGEVVRTMTGISDSSRRISEIIGLINGIAFQTNILALNAAVEAARAGEQGRGFAVVAAEVRTLAQRSADAAKEIKELIGDSVGRIDAGTKLVETAGSTMQEILASVKRVSALISEIADASREQSRGIAQVTSAVTQMEQVVQQNASLVEEASAATESMKTQADALLHGVSRFNIGSAETSHEPVAVRVPPPPAIRLVAAAAGKSAPAQESSGPRLVMVAGGVADGEWKEF